MTNKGGLFGDRGVHFLSRGQPDSRVEQNEDITARFMNEDDFKKLVSQHLLKQVYEQIHGQQAVG